MSKKIIEKFKSYFTQMDFNNNSALDEIYSDNIVFIDPIHEISGLDKLKQYFTNLNNNLIEGSFAFTDEATVNDKAYLSWEMKVALKRPKQNVTASGISVLTFEEDKIVKQRDYFDAGEMFYENIPILGSLIRFLKKKIGANKQ
jgi:limonene-1,2-epoxide hydrolase